MSASRRQFLRGGVATAAGLVAARAALGAPQQPEHQHQAPPVPPASQGAQPAAPPAPVVEPAGQRRTGFVPVATPDLAKLPYRLEDGVKVFHLTCDVVRQSFVPWREPFNTWGYNGSTPGPAIEVVEGDRVRLVVENRLPEETGIHWHGLEVPLAMDGVPGLIQDPIAPGGSYTYEFTLHQHGTFFYHSHMPMQEMMGMIGLFIVHPRRPYAPLCQRDFGLILQEWAILPNNQTPNTLAMEFNWLTINGKAGPATTPLLVKRGERVRLRFVNLGMDHHPMHLHGNTWRVTGTEGGRIPASAWIPGNTVLVGVAQARDVEFEAERPGDWMLHCHLPHHMMNHMASMVGPLSEPGAPGGTPVGLAMERGMGMPHGGHALSSENGPSLGRTLGSGEAERSAANGAALAPPGPAVAGHAAHAGPMQFHPPPPDARRVPGYPQDMFMVMDREVAKPETHGMRPTWTASMMGMMTAVRVLEPEMYDRIQELKAAGAAPSAEHPHGGAR